MRRRRGWRVLSDTEGTADESNKLILSIGARYIEASCKSAYRAVQPCVMGRSSNVLATGDRLSP